MIRFVIRKMLNKKWMMLSLLIGNILLISIAASNPMYTDAVLKRTLDYSLSNYIENSNRYPFLIKMVNSGYARDYNKVRDTERMLENSEEQMGLPVKEVICYYSTQTLSTTSTMERKDRRDDLSLAFLTDLSEHVTMVEGTLPSKEPDANGVIDVIVSERFYQGWHLLLGEEITVNNYTQPNGDPIIFRIGGVFKEDDLNDPYWVNSASYYSVCFMDPDLFRNWFMAGGNSVSIQSSWYVLYDYTDISIEDVPRIRQMPQYLSDYFNASSFIRITNYYDSILEEYQKSEAKVRTTFIVLQIPVLVLLAAFIFMVSSQLLDMEESEISVIKSRGASRGQIIGIYLIQSLVTVGVSLVIGIPLALFLVRMLGASSGFLEFVSRKAMDVYLSKEAWMYAIGAALFSVLTMVIPVFRHSRVSIVNQKQKRNVRRLEQPLWQRLFLDIILLGASIYGLFSFNNQKEILAQAVLEGKALDPMLFISSSLFMVGAGLFLLRVLPYLIRLIFWIFRNKWSPALYTSFVRVIRTRKQQGFIMAFLVMTIALGVFDASAARTIHRNDQRSLQYMTGADIVVEEKWADNSRLREDNPTLPLEYYEPDFGRYASLEGAESVTKVYVSKTGTVELGTAASKLYNVRIMGINTKEFGNTAWFDPELISPHWYNYLNAMAQRSDAVLVSSNFKQYGFNINDVIYYKGADQSLIKGVIYGFVDYWPSYALSDYRKGTDGVYVEQENFLVVGNLNEQQKRWGILPYQIWIKNKKDSSYIYKFIEKSDPPLKSFTDLSEELVAHTNDAVMQGTYGTLTVGWIVAMLVCSVGFLIYWILSIRSRELQFGIFRAMGMSMKEIIGMLLNEQLWISFVSIAAGAFVGWLTSKLFMPLIQIAYSSSESALPLEVVSLATDNVRLGIVVGLIVAVCIAILIWIIRKMKIAQALKLGED